MTKPQRSFRLDPELLEKAKRAGFDLVALFEAAMAKAVKDKRCPYCGNPMKKGGK